MDSNSKIGRNYWNWRPWHVTYAQVGNISLATQVGNIFTAKKHTYRKTPRPQILTQPTQPTNQQTNKPTNQLHLLRTHLPRLRLDIPPQGAVIRRIALQPFEFASSRRPRVGSHHTRRRCLPALCGVLLARRW